MRIFGSERVSKIMDMLKMEEGEAITHAMITKSIENAQKKVEAHNFDIRKHLIEYDDVMNKQREVIYTQRREILAGQDIRGSFLDMMDDTMEDLIAAYAIDKVTRPRNGTGRGSASGLHDASASISNPPPRPWTGSTR